MNEKKHVSYGIYVNSLGYLSTKNKGSIHIHRGNEYTNILDGSIKRIRQKDINLMFLAFMFDLVVDGWRILDLPHPIWLSDICICRITSATSYRIRPAGDGHSMTTTVYTEIIPHQISMDAIKQEYADLKIRYEADINNKMKKSECVYFRELHRKLTTLKWI